jgi:uncharacterized protein involved in outer membrane biogenesis
MKKALYAFAILVVLGVVGVWLAFNYVDVLVKWTLEHYGPDVTGVAVHVGEVKISPRDGRGSLRGLEIGNPPGFTSARAARFGEIRVALDPTTLTSEVIHIQELVVDGPDITYERGGKGTNLDAIQQRIDAYAKRSAAESQGGQGGHGPVKKRRFLIDRLVIRGGRATLTNAGLRGQGIGFDVPEVVLTDVGRRQGGVTASEAAAQVASALQQRIAQKMLTNLDLIRKGGVEGAIDALKGLLK